MICTPPLAVVCESTVDRPAYETVVATSLLLVLVLEGAARDVPLLDHPTDALYVSPCPYIKVQACTNTWRHCILKRPHSAQKDESPSRDITDNMWRRQRSINTLDDVDRCKDRLSHSIDILSCPTYDSWKAPEGLSEGRA